MAERRRAAEDREARFERRPVDPVCDPLDGAGSPLPPTGPAPPPGEWREGVMTASGLNALAGIWLIIAPFVLGYRDGDPYWNDIAFGAIILLLALIRLGGADQQTWPSVVSSLIGVWIFASAFWLDDSGRAAANDIIVGVIVFLLGALGVSATEEGAAAQPRRWYRR